MPRPPAQRFTFPALAVGVLAASTASILIRVADAPALALAFWRCALGALALAPFGVRAWRANGPLQPAARRQLGLSGMLLAGHFACFITALSLTTVASTAVLVTMAPLFVGLGAARFLGEPPSRRTWAGIALATGGAAVVGVADLGNADLGGRALLGDGLAFAGAALVAGYLLIGRLARQRLPVSLYAGVVYGVAAGVLLVACLLTGAELSDYDRTTWLAIAGLVVGPQLLGHTVFNTVLSTVSATVVAVVVLAEPVASTTLAYLLLAETPSPLFWAGGPLILAGVWLTATEGRRALPDPVAP
jgi:drug/metabolite transporter (DMT)-like permease